MSSHRPPTRKPSRDDRAFFETLVTLRDRYPAMAAADAEGLVGLHHAIALSNAEMRRAADAPEAPRAPHGVIHLGIEAN